MADNNQPVDPDLPPVDGDEIVEKTFDERLEQAEIEVNIFEGVRQPDGNPIMPVRLQSTDMFCFSCHKDVPCWNVCCHGADVTLTPGDIVRLSKRHEMTAEEFLLEYTVPAIWDKADMPVAKLKMTGKAGDGPCVFMDEKDGCTVYGDRPTTCRYYPLGMASIKMKDAEDKDDFQFLVKEPHCKGHEQDKLQNVNQFREEQGVIWYDAVNRGWYDVLMKMASWRSIGGPGGKVLDPQKKKMFFMISTDVDAFRRFVFDSSFLDKFAIEPEVVEAMRESDFELMKFGFRWLRFALAYEPTVKLNPKYHPAAQKEKDFFQRPGPKKD